MSSDSERSAEVEARAKACRYDWIYFRLLLYAYSALFTIASNLFRAAFRPSEQSWQKKKKSNAIISEMKIQNGN